MNPFVVVAVAVLLWAVGCSNESDSPDPRDFGVPGDDEEAGVDAGSEDTAADPMDTAGDVPTDTSEDDGGRADTGPDPDGALDGGETGRDVARCGGRACGPDEACVDGECVAERRVKCREATDLGVLQVGDTTEITGTFAGAEDAGLTASCAAEGTHPEKVYKFSVAAHSQIQFDTDFSGFDAKLEFRQGQCLDKSGEYGGCRDSDGTFFAPAGSSFFLVVEQDAGSGGPFSIDLTAKASCSFGAYGDYGCQMGDRYLCERVDGSPNEKKFACPSGCAGGECLGGSCANPVVIQASDGYSKTFQGDLGSYSADYNFADGNGTCSVQGQQPASPGPEVIFEVRGVQKGQTLTVDTEGDPNTNLSYIANNCRGTVDQIACAATGQESASLTVKTDGDYYIYVDKFTGSANKFNYEIRIE